MQGYYGTAPVIATSGGDHDRSGYMAALLIVIVLVILFASWGRRGDEGGGFRGDFGRRGLEDWSPSNFITMARSEDRDVAAVRFEGERNTMALERLIESKNCEVRDAIDRESRRRDDRDYQDRILDLKERLAEEREKNMRAENVSLFERTNEHILKSQDILDRKIEALRAEFPCRPPVYARVDTPVVEDVGVLRGRRFRDAVI